jgi:hypothetical protein
MNTEAWRLKDLHTGLASYTQLKHDTVLYTKPPGGLGGGGELFSYGYVEPNPLVFARIAVVSGLMYEGLRARGLTEIPYEEPVFDPDTGTFSDSAGFNLRLSLSQLPVITTYGAKLADMANRSLRGEPYTEDEYMLLQGISMFFGGIRMTLQDPNNPEPVALVVDIANDYQGMQTLQQGVGGVDYIYTVVTGPKGLLRIHRRPEQPPDRPGMAGAGQGGRSAAAPGLDWRFHRSVRQPVCSLRGGQRPSPTLSPRLSRCPARWR